MFGIGAPELLVILAVALIVIGPKKLPDLARSLGRALGEFRNATNDLKQSIERETGLDEIRKDITGAGREAFTALTSSPSQSAPPSPPAQPPAEDGTSDPAAPQAPSSDGGVYPDSDAPSDDSPTDHPDGLPPESASAEGTASTADPESADDDQGKTAT